MVKLAAAYSHSAERINSLGSRIIAENVVKAPMKPTRIIVLVSPETGHRLSNNAQSSPAMKQPIILTEKVPHGKDGPMKRCTKPASPYLDNVPSAPARPSNMSL